MDDPNDHSDFEPEWIGLALSGGGLRATLFHLGVIRLLHACDLLKRVRIICSVSGGSILAAHLALNWSSYIGTVPELESKADAIKKFAKSDIRNRVVRRWLCGPLFFMLPRLFGKLRMSSLIQESYSTLYNGAIFSDLAKYDEQPEIHLLATSLTTGDSCRFTNTGFELLRGDNPKVIALTQQPVALAVAASAAFPAFFPAVPVGPDVFKCGSEDIGEHVLADGGIFDNLAIEDLCKTAKIRMRQEKILPEKGLLIISDASAHFGWEVEKKYSSVFSIFRNARAVEIMMRRLSDLGMAAESFDSLPLCRVDIGQELRHKQQTALIPETQRAVCNIRTDLNSFSDIEIDSLIEHGFFVARAALQQQHVLVTPFANYQPASEHDSPSTAVKLMKIQDAKRRRLLNFAIDDIATWWLILGVLVWIGAISFGSWLMVTRCFRSGQSTAISETSIRDSIALLQQAKDEIQGKTGIRQYLIKVIDPSGSPVPGANINVQLKGGSVATHDDFTNSSGFFEFSWGPSAEPIEANIEVNVEGFSTLKDVVRLSEEEPVHIIQLNKRD